MSASTLTNVAVAVATGEPSPFEVRVRPTVVTAAPSSAHARDDGRRFADIERLAKPDAHVAGHRPEPGVAVAQAIASSRTVEMIPPWTTSPKP